MRNQNLIEQAREFANHSAAPVSRVHILNLTNALEEAEKEKKAAGREALEEAANMLDQMWEKEEWPGNTVIERCEEEVRAMIEEGEDG